MKLALVLAASASVASAHVRATAGLLSKARRLEDADVQEEQGDEYSFLSGFSAKLIGCAAGETYVAANGESEYSSVIFRLCPSDSCDSSHSSGCKSGYGDYVIGLNSYVNAYIEQNRDNMQQDDNVRLDQLSECRQYDYQPADDGAEAVAYFLGPTCDGKTGLKMALFTEETCTTLADGVSFSDISGGASLPYSSDLVSTKCEACSITNDNDESEISDFCLNMYTYSGHCETKMNKNSQYSSNDESACDYIATVTQSHSSSGGGAGAAIGWVIFALVVVGLAGFGYTKWWTSKKQSQADGLMG